MKFICITTLAVALLGSSSLMANDPVEYEEHAGIMRAVKQYISVEVHKIHKGEFTIKVGSIDPRHRLPKCAVPLKTFVTSNNFRGSAMTVGVRCEKPSPWLIYIPGKISMFQSVYVARQTMARGHRITANDLQKMRYDTTRLHYGYIDKKKDIVGKITRRVVFAKTVLKPQMLGLPIIVKRGQNVIIIAETQGIQVRMSGKALGSGSAGKAIRVRNLSSRRIVEGVILRSGVVKIIL